MTTVPSVTPGVTPLLTPFVQPLVTLLQTRPDKYLRAGRSFGRLFWGFSVQDIDRKRHYLTREGHEMSSENRAETIVQPRSEIADALVAAVAETTGLKAEQIVTITAGTEQILIGYRGAQPGLIGGAGRIAVQTYDTKTGQLIGDSLVEDPADRARMRANVDAKRRALFAQNPDLA